MNQLGVIVVYNVTESTNNLASIGSDFGMDPNSRIRLTKINVITTAIPALRFVEETDTNQKIVLFKIQHFISKLYGS